MRTLRIEKLAELKKMAEPTGPLNQNEISTISSWIESKRKSLGQEYVDSAVGDLAKQIYQGFVSDNQSKLGVSLLTAANFKKYIISYIVYFLLDSTITPETFPIKMIRPGMGFAGTPEQLNELQLALANAIAEGRAALPDPKKWNQENKREKGGGTQSTSSSSGPQATRAYTELKAPAQTTLEEVGSDGKKYKYTILSSLSFSYIADGMNKPATVTTSYSKWNQAAENLNALYGKNSAAQATTSATPATTPTAATDGTTSGTGSQNVVQLDSELVRKVEIILRKAQTYTLNVGSVANEQNQIAHLKNIFNQSYGLARIIVSRIGQTLSTIAAATIEELNATRRKDLAVHMKGKFSGDVGKILGQVNEIVKMENKSPASIQQLKSMLNVPAGQTAQQQVPASSATPPATPAASDKADDGQIKKSSLDKKFIKAATLRRLKIRSQMEAAIDSSAQMGRARVS